jgi:hypothetical protein
MNNAKPTKKTFRCEHLVCRNGYRWVVISTGWSVVERDDYFASRATPDRTIRFIAE